MTLEQLKRIKTQLEYRISNINDNAKKLGILSDNSEFQFAINHQQYQAKEIGSLYSIVDIEIQKLEKEVADKAAADKAAVEAKAKADAEAADKAKLEKPKKEVK